MKKTILAAALAALCGTAQADEIQDRIAKSKEAIQAFSAELKGQLEAGMKEGGPVNAIGVCNKVASAIAHSQSEKSGMKLARTSLKVRNASNAPDAWEEAVLKQFEEKKAAGEDPNNLAKAEVVEADGKKSFRFMKAIPTGEVCLKCHGETIDPAVKAKLDELYPNDKATGFKLGDIRGAFTITQPM